MTLTKSREVEIKHRPIVGFKTYIDELDIIRKKIGSKFDKNGKIFRPLSYTEEMMLLKDIIGVSPTSDKWESEVIEYWKNISILIPKNGKLLETGLILENEDQVYAMVREDDGNVSKKEIELIESGKVRPINIVDYITFRIALKHSVVANQFEYIYNSPKIMFYLTSKDMEIKKKLNDIELEDKAQMVYFDVMKDKTTVRNILVMFDLDYATMTEEDKRIAIKKLSKEKSAEFIKVSKDKSILMKCFINLCIKHKLLNRLPNTEIIKDVDNDKQIGTNISEVVAYLQSPNPENQTFFNNLQARLNIELAKIQDKFEFQTQAKIVAANSTKAELGTTKEPDKAGEKSKQEKST